MNSFAVILLVALVAGSHAFQVSVGVSAGVSTGTTVADSDASQATTAVPPTFGSIINATITSIKQQLAVVQQTVNKTRDDIATIKGKFAAQARQDLQKVCSTLATLKQQLENLVEEATDDLEKATEEISTNLKQLSQHLKDAASALKSSATENMTSFVNAGKAIAGAVACGAAGLAAEAAAQLADLLSKSISASVSISAGISVN